MSRRRAAAGAPDDRRFRLRQVVRRQRRSGAPTRRAAASSWSATARRARPTVRIVDPDTGNENPGGQPSARSGCTGRTSPWATGTSPRQTERRIPATQLVDAVAGHSRGAVAAHRGSGRHVRRRAVHRRPHQGSVDRDGRNHYPEDIEATIQEITGGRVAAISVPDERTEQLVAIIELKKRGDTDEESLHRLGIVKREVTSAISQSHGLARRRPGAGAARLDPDHDERQGAARGLRRAVPASAVHPPGRLAQLDSGAAPPVCHPRASPDPGRRARARPRNPPVVAAQQCLPQALRGTPQRVPSCGHPHSRLSSCSATLGT